MDYFDQYDKLIEKCVKCDVSSEVYAVLKLVAYRASFRLPSNYFALFSYDYVEPQSLSSFKAFKRTFFWPISILYLFKNRICGNKHKGNSGKTVLLSDTFLMLDRYDDIMDELLDNYNILSFLNYNSTCSYLGYKGKNDLYVKRFNSRRIYVGPFIVGRKLIEAVMYIYDVFCKVAISGKDMTIEESIIAQMSEYIHYQKNKISKQLRRNKVSCFITTNQYNLVDLICIMACKECNIVTKELDHCINALFRKDYYKDSHQFSYVQVQAVWNEADIIWRDRYSNCQNLLYERCFRESVGCPELAKEVYAYYTANNPKKMRSVVLFSPISYFGFAERVDDVDLFLRWRRRIYESVSRFAKNNHLEVYVRYRPGEKHAKEEKKYFDEMAFHVVGDTRKDFYSIISTCQYAISATSAVLYMALQFGCRCFCYIIDDEEYDFCGLDITAIKLEELAECIIDCDCSNHNGVPDFFDPVLLF